MQVEKLGPYRIGKRIGKGGMGAVYEAISELSDEEDQQQRVAIKALSPQLAMVEGFRERFEAEIESLKKLNHPGIVRLYGYGEQDGILFYSMELVVGSTLEDEIKSGRRFDWHETLQIGIQVCRALKHAHDHGVVHRDIKPANLMLTEEEIIKVADFGIARLFGGTQLTTVGGVLGTADYMSPEQADGRAVTEKCDQYGLGGVLYAMLAGRPPFRASSMPEMLQMQRFAEPEPVSRYATNTPRDVDRLLNQLLAKDPEERFPNVLVLSRHMEAMDKALSRSQSKSSADPLAIDESTPNPVPLDFEGNLEGQVTQELVSQESLRLGDAKDEISLELADAPTIAKPESGATSRPQRTIADPHSTSVEPKTPKTRFTTIDEDQRRQREETRENRLSLIMQLASLVIAIGIMLGGGWYLMLPASVDDLYQAITSATNGEGTLHLSAVESEISEFLANYPNDPRFPEIQGYQERLEFEQFERRLRNKRSFQSQGEASAVERIYSQAMKEAGEDPAAAAALLRALIALYDPLGETEDQIQDSGDTDKLLLFTARKQIDELIERAQEKKAIELPMVRERMEAARVMSRSDPQRAKRMYQAIVKIYGSKSWAKSAVDEARVLIKEMSKSDQ